VPFGRGGVSRLAGRRGDVGRGEGIRQSARHVVPTAPQGPGDKLPGQLGVARFVARDALQRGTHLRLVASVQACPCDERCHRFAHAAVDEGALRHRDEVGVDA
jgi:hypothetical protein